LVGLINGVEGIKKENITKIDEETYAPYRNLGGCDYLGKSTDNLKSEYFEDLGKLVKKHNITGMILVGATHTMTDACLVTEYFMKNDIDTKVVVVPATLDGNVRHNYFETSIGFDTATKVYSQLIGNMLTDSASAIKYWYFIRLMGKDPSHLALECALKTHPNMVIISEEAS